MDPPNGTSPIPGTPTSPVRDPVVLLGFLVWVISLLPSLAPVLSPGLTLTWADQYSDAPVLTLVLLAAGAQVKRSHRQRERVFWRLVVGGVLGWLSVRALYVLVPFEQWGTGLDLASDLFYLAGYLAVALALERRPDQAPARGPDEGMERVESLGTLIFSFGLLTYFILIPSVFNPQVYASWVSSLLLYAVLDLYLLVRVLTILRDHPQGGWRGAYRWLALTFAAWLVGDLTEGLMYLETIPFVFPGTPLDLLWHLPGLFLLLAIRQRSRDTVGAVSGVSAWGIGGPALGGLGLPGDEYDEP